MISANQCPQVCATTRYCFHTVDGAGLFNQPEFSYVNLLNNKFCPALVQKESHVVSENKVSPEIG